MLDFLSALRTSGANMDDDVSVKRAQQQMLESCLVDLKGAPPIRMTQATQMLKDVQNAAIPDWMRDNIRECVQEKVLQQENPENPKQASNKTQRNMHLHNYLTQDEWNALRSPVQSANTKMHLMCKRFHLLRLTCPSETTSVLAISILLLSSHQGDPEELQVPHQRAYRILEDFKATLKTVTKRTKRSDLLMYPETVQNLPPEILKGAYPAALPVECPLDVRVLCFLAEDLPARKSRATLSSKKSSFCQGGVDFKEMLSNPLLSRMLEAFQQPHDLIQMLPPKKRKSLENKNGEVAIQFGNEQRAICAGEAEPAAHDATEAAPEADVPRAAAANKPVPTDAAKKIEEAQSPKSIDEMAAHVQQQLAHNKNPKKEKPEATAPAPKDQKAKPKTKSKAAKTVKQESALKFAGTKQRNPIHFGDFTIYTCPKSCNWRVKRNGEKKDKAFSWKQGEKETWERLIAFVTS